jgi:large subunit ribosomal protein L21
MHAVIATGGKQYRLTTGDVIKVEKLSGEAGDQVVFDQVLMVNEGENSRVGTPLVEGAKVLATILEQGKGQKLIVFKYKKRKMYRRKTGHRQQLTQVRVDSIEA